MTSGAALATRVFSKGRGPELGSCEPLSQQASRALARLQTRVTPTTGTVQQPTGLEVHTMPNNKTGLD